VPTRELRVVITGDAKSLSAALGRSKAELTGFGSSADRIASKLTRAGATMTHNVTLPIVAAGAAAVKFDLDFEQSLNHIQSLVGANSREMEGYRQSILELAPAVGKGPKELADALYFITSSGFKGAQALQILTVSAKASAAGLGETQTVADAVTSAVNAYGSSALSAGKATDILTATVREGKGEPDQLAQAIGRVIAPAQAAGVSFDQVGASIAGLTLDGLDANEAVTSLRGILFTFQKVAGPTAEALHKIGRNAGDIRQEIKDKGLIATLIDLRGEFKGNDAELSKLFPNVRALNGFLALTGQTADKNVGIFQRLAQTNHDTNTAFQKSARTTAFEVTQSWAEIQTDLVMAGAIILPVVASIGHDVAGLVHEFSQLPESGQKAALLGAGLIAGLGPAMSFVGNATKAVRGLGLAVVALERNPLIAIGLLAASVLGAAIVIDSRNREIGKSFADIRDEIRQTTDAFEKWHDAQLAEQNASLQVKRAHLELAQTTQALNKLTSEGKKGTLEWREAYLNHRQAVLDVMGAEQERQRALGAEAKTEVAARTAGNKATANYNDTLNRANHLLKLYSDKNTDITGKQRLLAEVNQHLTGDMNKNAAAFDAAAKKVDDINPKLAASYRHAADVARAIRDLSGQLNHLPTHKEIQIEIAITKMEHTVDVGRHQGRYRSKKTNWTGTPHLGGDGVTWINERGTELLTAPDGTSAMLVKLDPGTRIDRAADSRRGGGGVTVKQYFGSNPDPRAAQAEAAWNMRRLLPHAVA
jgi:TP901 family phage tail tape measure protein